jgi:hypothetical protein
LINEYSTHQLKLTVLTKEPPVFWVAVKGESTYTCTDAIIAGSGT